MKTFRNGGHNAIVRPLGLTLTLGLSFLLGACSGGSSSSNGSGVVNEVVTPTPTPTTQTLEGTAAVGAAIVDGIVTARCANGNSFTEEVKTDADGSWSGTIDSAALPCALQVSGGTPAVTLHSYAAAPGTVNITPLTDLVLALATLQTPQDWFNGFSGDSVDIGTASGTLLDKFAGNGFDIPSTGNPFTTPFTTNGTGWDGLLDQIGQSIADDPGLADHAALVTIVKDGNLDNLPAAPAPVTYTISGTVTGASANVVWETIVGGQLLHDGGSGNGDVTFSPSEGIAQGSSWRVAINTAPAGQSCVVNNGSGTLSANVTNVEIVCTEAASFSLSGTISGASGAVGWTARRSGANYNTGSDSNGAVTFTLPAGMVENSNWRVLVTSAPAGQTCSVSNGSGTLKADVTNIAIQCSDEVIVPNTYTISGSITGASGLVQWQTFNGMNFHHDGSNNNGSVAFTTAAGMEEGSSWRVQVSAAPTGQSCAVSNGSGTLAANVSNVLISCSDTNVVPGDAIYDFSSLNLKPTVPGMTPIAPSVNPVDPSLDIAALYAALGEREKARVFAPAPDNLQVEIDSYQREYYLTQSVSALEWTRRLSIDAGADGETNTADDIITAYTVYPDGVQGVAYSFTHPGPDAVWFTEDDVPGVHLSGRKVYFPDGVVLEYEDASEGVILVVPFLDTGADGKLFTADDVVNFSVGYQIAILDGEGNRGQIVTYDAYGADKQWFTADDVVDNYVMATSALSGRQLISVVYNSPGSDGSWFTADDVVKQHTQIQLGSDYLPRYSAVYDSPSGDSTWFTADDRVLAWTYYGYDGKGNAVLVATHTNKGSDGVWFTADDTASGLVSLKDANGRSIVEAIISGSGAMGPDGIWLSGDETLYGYAYTEFDANGNKTLNAQIQSKGADGKWFTSDDLPTASYNYWTRNFDSQGRMTQQVYYNPALAPASPAFSEAQIERYTVYNPDLDISVSVYRDLYGSSFGNDGKPFTADDFIGWPYVITTDSGSLQYNQPGPDAIWFTDDDVRSGSIVQQFEGNRKTLEQYLDANGDVVSYSEVSELTPTSYRTDSYQVDETGSPVLTGYNIVEEDGNGYPRWTTWYTVEDVITNVGYTEYDSRGNITRQSSAYSPGNDGIWATADDFGYYALQFFNSDNELVSDATEYPGADRVWGTLDDYVGPSRILQLEYDFDQLQDNAGYVARSCDDLMIVSSGSINVLVRDQDGEPLAGVIAQLNSQGSTVTTDASGTASFSGLSGAQDVHLFKDGYNWESFYCVAPGSDVTVQGRLASRNQPALDSKVNFQATPGNYYYTLRLLDDEGYPVSSRSQSSSSGAEYGQTYGSIYFGLPADSEVTGELWALQVDRYGVLLSAQSLGQQTHTTIASNLYSDYQPIELAFTESQPIAVAARGTLAAPGGQFATMAVSLGGLYDLPFRYDASLGGTYAAVPDVTDVELPLRAQPTALKATGDNWEAWYPGDYPELGEGVFVASVITGFQYEPLVQTQSAPGDQPTIQWTPVRQMKEDAFATVTSLELRSAVGGQGYQSHWTLHLPAGDSSVQLPRLPAGISDALLPEKEYRMVIRSRAIPSLDYSTAVATEDLHKLSAGLATERLSTGNDYDGGNLLQRQ
ncbi:MAG: carboxypeptidase regulatory-like domain-containing protein [Halioglobus sp.]|nr:carboxypeptidase regulatory-like domain-containing protein [Halioglobus sp.]